MIVKIVNDELIKFSEIKMTIKFQGGESISFLIVGLQGSGKTSTSAKLAKLIETKYKKKFLWLV